MPIPSALDVAAYFVELAGENNENDLTNMKLQKLLYFAQCEHLKKNGSPLFLDAIEAWQYGPVVPAVYDVYKTCGAFPITVFDVLAEDTNTAALSDDVRGFVKSVWDRYSRFSASFLVSLTHKKGEPWDRVYNDPSSTKTIDIGLLAASRL
jgi:uncharacterized phage-associated protein